MTGFVLTAAAISALAIQCGQGVPENRLKTVAWTESRYEPYAIGVNEDRSRGLPHEFIHSTTAKEAIAKAKELWAQKRKLDLGLMGISDANLDRHNLTLQTAFDQCANMRAGANHLADDRAWVLAHRRYNCGRIDCGIAYADGIQKILSQDFTLIPSGVNGAKAQEAPSTRLNPNPFTQPAATSGNLVFARRKDMHR